jgi:hypothetical protein
MIVDGVEAREIPGFSNYAVTSDGRVYSKSRMVSCAYGAIRSNPGKWLSLDRTIDGYPVAWLWGGNKRISQRVHRLVLEAFVGPCPAGMECCHNNGVRTDNRVENLRWDTRKANIADAIRHGTHNCLRICGEGNQNAKLTKADVRMIVYMSRTGEFMQKEIAELYGIDTCTISDILHRRTWLTVWSEGK